MKPGAIEMFIRLAILIGLLYVVYGVRLAIAYKRWIKRRSSWRSFWPYRNHCEANGFDWTMEFLAGIIALGVITLWIMLPVINN